MGVMKTERHRHQPKSQHKHKTLLREVEASVGSTLRKATLLGKQLASLFKRASKASGLLKVYRRRINMKASRAQPSVASECAPTQKTIIRLNLNPKRHRAIESNATQHAQQTVAAACEPPKQTILPPKPKAKRARESGSSSGDAQQPTIPRAKPKRKVLDKPADDVVAPSTAVGVCSVLALEQ
jgi:hypothetical protein